MTKKNRLEFLEHDLVVIILKQEKGQISTLNTTDSL